MDVPEELTQALAKADLAGFFSECTPAHRREYLKWINEAKRPETRSARIAETVKRLAAKRSQEKARRAK